MADAETVGEAVGENVTAAIEVAQEKQAQAEADAAAIADAAMETLRGQRIETIEKGLDECKTTLNQLPELMAAQTMAVIQPLAERLSNLESNLQSAVVAVLEKMNNPPAPTPSTPPAPEAPPAPVVNPEAAPAPAPESAPAKKKHHFL